MDDVMRALPVPLLSVLPLLLCGCQDSNAPSEPDANSANGITVSLPAPGDVDLPPDGGSSVEVVTIPPEQDEIATLVQSLQDLESHRFSDNDQQQPVLERQRHLKIVEISTDVMRLTAQIKDRQQEFQFALRQRLNSRLQLALNGSKADVDQLYKDVETLNTHDESSIATAEGIYTLARFAHAMAKRGGAEDVRWFENFSRWAREFSRRFPNQSERAAALLLGAGRSCEVRMMKEQDETASRLRQQAKLCFTELAEKYADRSESAQAAAALRRMALTGTPLTQFSGPAMNGGKISSTDFSEGQTLIYFWESDSREFQETMLPLLKGLPPSVKLIGVSLDQNADKSRDSVSRLQLPGKQILFGKDSAGWNSPLIRFWSIPSSPCCWILRDGTVLAVDVSAEALSKKLN